MNRRKFLTSLSVMLGCSISSLDVLAINSALAFTGTGKVNQRLTEQQFIMISIIADIIIPKSDTPSASEAGVTQYIDFYLHEFLAQTKRTEFLQGLASLHVSISSFLSLTNSDKVAVIQSLDDNLHTPQENANYKSLKQLIVIGYYTSEIGATQALKFDPIPGPYKEMKLKEVGGVWF